jgi:acetyl-CoA carboxylase carboxyltransferase component
MLAALVTLDEALAAARDGGGERAVTRHHARGKLLPRERIDLLVDRDAPLLELSPVAGWGTDTTVGAAVVTAVGVVENVECVIVASDPTVGGGAASGYTLRKIQRAGQVARENGLPLICLVESDGVQPSQRTEAYLHASGMLAEAARLHSAAIPTVGVLFGDSGGPGIELAACCDHIIALRRDAVAHSGRHLAVDERDALRLTRQCVRRCNRVRPVPRLPAAPAPRHDPEDLLAIPAPDPRTPFDPREILARILDDSEFDEFAGGAAGAEVRAGWGRLHGWPVGVLATCGGRVGTEDARGMARFLHHADAAGTPVLLLRHCTFAAAGADAVTAAALAGTGVPRLAVTVGTSYGIDGGAATARFRFSWPNATPPGLAQRQPAHARGRHGEEAADDLPAARPGSAALYLSGQLHDDGVIDPRDTRTVLGLCLSASRGGVPTRAVGA